MGRRRETFEFVTYVQRTDDEGQYDADVNVTYEVEGNYQPATYDSPAEYPEISIISVTDLETDEEILDEISAEDFNKLIEEATDDLEKQ
jgi:hypothetical protein